MNAPQPSRDAHFVAVLLIAIVCVPNILAAVWAPGICATCDLITDGKPLPYFTQWLRSGSLAFVAVSAVLPFLSFWLYLRASSALFSVGVLFFSLLLSIFIGLALMAPILVITRQMAVH